MRHANLVIAVWLAVPGVASAQSAGAEALFREGRALIKRGELDAGCKKLQQSENLESSVGTLLNLGDCREKQGRYASAWAAFRKAEDMAQRNGSDKKRMIEARRRAQKLEDSLATITIQVGPNGRADGVVIKRNGEVLDPTMWGTAIVVDPGDQTIVAESTGRKPWRTEVSIGKGGKRWVVVPSLEPEVTARVAPTPPPTPPRADAPPPRPVIPPPPVIEAPPPEPEIVVEPAQPVTIAVTPTWSKTRGVAVGVAVIGAGALVGGIAYGKLSNDYEERSNAACPSIECSIPGALHDNDQAQRAARYANYFFIGSGAAALVATTLWFVGKPDSETVVAPSIGDDHVGVSLAGRL